MFARKFTKGMQVKVGDGEFPLDVVPRKQLAAKSVEVNT